MYPVIEHVPFPTTVNARERRRLKKEFNYDPDPPRCSTCESFEKGAIQTFNSVPAYVKSRCRLMEMRVTTNAICDQWKDAKTGESLER